MSDATDQFVEDVASKVDEVALGAFASGVDTSVDYPLQVERLEKSSGGVTAVDGATFEVGSGTLTGFVGPNGVRKSTMFNLIAGMLRLDADTVIFSGEDITGGEPHQIANCGMVRTSQIAHELDEMTVLENMMPTSKHQRGEVLWRLIMPDVRDDVCEQEAKLLERVWEVLDLLDIIYIAKEYAGNPSGGQHKLLEMARAPLTDPDMLLLDEPFAGVNPTLEKKLPEYAHELREQGYTFLLVEYDMDFIMNNREYVIVLHQGSVLMKGTPDEIRSNGEVIEAYLGGNV